MELFKSYIIDEFKDKTKGYVATEFKFTHTVNIKIDLKSYILLKNEIIKVNVKLVDKDMNQLHSAIVTFENNIITKANSKYSSSRMPGNILMKKDNLLII